MTQPGHPFGRFSRSEFGDLRIRARRYTETLRWLLKKLYQFDRRRFLFVIYLAFFGRSLQAVALALLFLVARAIESDTTSSVAGYSVHFRDPDKLLGAVVAAGCLLLLGAVLAYRGRRILVNAATEFANACSREALLIERTVPHAMHVKQGDPVPTAVRQVAIGTSNLTRACLSVLTVLSPLTVFVFAIASLLYLSPVTAAGLLLFVLPTSALFYLINLRAVRNQRSLIVANGRRKRSILKLAERVSGVTRPAEFDRDAIEECYRQADFNEAIERFRYRLLTTTRAEFIANLLTAIAISGLVIYLGLTALNGTMGWAVMLSIVVALRFVLVSLRGVVVSITEYARFHPSVRTMYELFVHAVPKASLSVGSMKLRSTWKPLGLPALENATLIRGQPAAMMSPTKLGRYTVFSVARDVSGATRRVKLSRLLAASTFVVNNRWTGAPYCLADVVGDGDIAAARASLEKLRKILPKLPDLNARIDPETYSTLEQSDRAALGIASAVLSGFDVIFVQATFLSALESEAAAALFAAFDDRFWILVYPARTKEPCAFDEPFAMISSGDGRIVLAEPDALATHWVKARKSLWDEAEIVEEDDDDDDEGDEGL